MKHCRKCGQDKPLDEFPNNRSKSGGKAAYCKPCWNAYMRDQSVKHRDRKDASNARWLAANHERKLAQQAAWRAANAEHIRQRNAEYRAANRDKIRAYALDYNKRTSEAQKAKYRANPEPAKQKARAWRISNLDHARELGRRWREANPDKYREQQRLASQRRRARKANLPNYKITKRDVMRLLSSPCAVTGCGNRDITLDHVIPLARGGSHGIGNLQSMCQSHNSAKGARLWIEFRVYLASLTTIAA